MTYEIAFLVAQMYMKSKSIQQATCKELKSILHREALCETSLATTHMLFDIS